MDFASHPHSMKRKIDLPKAFKLYFFIKKYSEMIQDKNISVFAGGTTFFFILSVIPMLIFLASLIPFTSLTKADLIRIITDLSPDFADMFITFIIEQAFEKSVSLVSISAIVTVWSGSLGMLALIRGLNFMDGVPERRNYFLLRGIAAFYTVILLLAFVLIFVVVVLGSSLRGNLEEMLPALKPVIEKTILFRYPVMIIVGTFLFLIMFTYIPSTPRKFLHQLPGAVFTALVWALFSLFFSLYVNRFDSFSLYGSLAAIVIVMFWLYGCFSIFFVGALINRYLFQGIDEIKEIVT